jgi:hypothetical protein
MDDTIRGLATRIQVPERQQACFDGQGPGFGQWKRNAGTDARGQILCYATDGSARVFWSYDGDNILVGAVATGPDVPAVVTWFTTPQFSTDLR